MAAAISIISIVSACDQSLRGQPSLTIGDEKLLERTIIETHLSEATVIAALKAPSLQTRNQIVFARIAEIDLLYNDFESALLTESKQSNFILALAGALAALGGGFSTGQTSQVYSLIGGGVTALQTSYSKEILAELTVQAAISQMRAERAKVKAQIYQKLIADHIKYPVEAALSDLQRYRQAGTLASALSALAEQATIAERSGTAAAEKASQALLFDINVTPNRDVGKIRSSLTDFILATDDRTNAKIYLSMLVALGGTTFERSNLYDSASEAIGLTTNDAMNRRIAEILGLSE